MKIKKNKFMKLMKALKKKLMKQIMINIKIKLINTII